MGYVATPYADVQLGGSTPQKTALRNDDRAVYSQALQWVVTGDQAHADKAIEILDAWSSTIEKITRDGETDNSYVALVASWNVHIWIAGAEIVRYYDDGAAGWSDAKVTQFDHMAQVFETALSVWDGTPQVHPDQDKYSGTNCAFSIGLSRMALGIYTNDDTLFDEGKDHLMEPNM